MINLIAIVWVAFISVILSLPDDMRAGKTILAFTLLLGLWYAASERRRLQARRGSNKAEEKTSSALTCKPRVSAMNQRELAQVFARANEFKEGDLLIGGTRDEHERDDARRQLSALRLGEITRNLVEDSLSLALARSLSAPLANEIAHLTIDDLKRILLRRERRRLGAALS